jgi:hypothetical protein
MRPERPANSTSHTAPPPFLSPLHHERTPSKRNRQSSDPGVPATGDSQSGCDHSLRSQRRQGKRCRNKMQKQEEASRMSCQDTALDGCASGVPRQRAQDCESAGLTAVRPPDTSAALCERSALHGRWQRVAMNSSNGGVHLSLWCCLTPQHSAPPRTQIF